MSTNHGGKGDRRRPLTIPEEQFNANWDAIFNKELTDEQRKKEQQERLAAKVISQIHDSIHRPLDATD